MKAGAQSLLLSFLCAVAAGFLLPQGWSGVRELLGIAGLIAGVSLPMPTDDNGAVTRLKAALLLCSAVLVLSAIYLNLSSTWTVWIVAVCLFTALSGSALELSGIGRIKLSTILYVVCGLGIAAGYFASLYVA